MHNLSHLFQDQPELPVQGEIRVIGIDLGTTNATVAEVIGEPSNISSRCIEVEQYTTEGKYKNTLVPSVVALYQNKEIIGEGAKQLRARTTQPGFEQNRNIFYECKNDIGILRTYHKAPEGYKSAAEIGGRVLKFLYNAAGADNAAAIDRIVVTVPASFQAAQRADTLKAAALAGINLNGGDLLDEPVAAFLDYFITHAGSIDIGPNETKNLVVFDFGGGTCDVAVFQLSRQEEESRLMISSRAVSRYHRLGGGDIDAAILHEVLIPQIIEQNGIAGFDLGFQEKKRIIEPSFIGVAEALKIGLCNEITRLEKFGTCHHEEMSKVFITQPGRYSCKLDNGKALSITSPTMTVADFEKVLAPFLERDLLYARESEYRLTCSIFAPLQDALDRSDLDRKRIDYCLLVGGSCLIPQVTRAVKQFLPSSAILGYADADSVQTAVARGAAFHALSMALYGRGLVQPVCHDTIAINTESGPVDLIPKNAQYPYPSDGSYALAMGLLAPETSLTKPFDLKVELVAREDNRLIQRGVWKIEPPVNKGDRLALEYRYDQNQVLDVRMRLADVPNSRPFGMAMENPHTNVVNPQAIKLKIDRAEEDLRAGVIPQEQRAEKIVELAAQYADIRQHEKAIDYLGRVLRVKNAPDPLILNRMGLYSGEIGDTVRSQKYYTEAGNNSSWSVPWFNLAYAQMSAKKYPEAMESVNKAIKIDASPTYLVLKAQVAGALEDLPGRDKLLKDALSNFGSHTTLANWELGWFLTAAHQAGDAVREAQAQEEMNKRRKGKLEDSIIGALPLFDDGFRKV